MESNHSLNACACPRKPGQIVKCTYKNRVPYCCACGGELTTPGGIWQTPEPPNLTPLLPCPFCGSSATMHTGGHGKDGREILYSPGCDNDQCVMNANNFAYINDANMAYTAWNTRQAAYNRPKAEVEDLIEAAQALISSFEYAMSKGMMAKSCSPNVEVLQEVIAAMGEARKGAIGSDPFDTDDSSAATPSPTKPEQPDEATTGGFMLTDEQIKHMRDRFLGWKLPENFNPDGGISFAKKPYNHINEPIGTNLLDAQQAEEMIRYMLQGLPVRESGTPEAIEFKNDRICVSGKWFVPVDSKGDPMKRDDWQPIETAPRDGAEFLVAYAEKFPRRCSIASYREQNGRIYLEDRYDYIDRAEMFNAKDPEERDKLWKEAQESSSRRLNDRDGFICSPLPTHWMPLPAVPDVEDGAPHEN